MDFSNENLLTFDQFLLLIREIVLISIRFIIVLLSKTKSHVKIFQKPTKQKILNI